MMRLIHQGNHKLKLYQSHNLDYPPHLHNALEIVYLTAGNCTVQQDRQHHLLQPGDWFVCFPNRVHGYEDSTNAEAYVLIIPISPYLTPYYNTLEQKLPDSPLIPKGTWEHTGLRTVLQLSFQEEVDENDPVLLGYIHVIVGKLLSLMTLQDTPATGGNALQTLLLYLHDNYTQPLTRKQIAKAVGYNESHISHLFTDTLHMTLKEYLTAMRLYDATALLTQTEQSVSQIALSLGFGSIRSFNRTFQQYMHISPTAYRTARKK